MLAVVPMVCPEHLSLLVFGIYPSSVDWPVAVLIEDVSVPHSPFRRKPSLTLHHDHCLLYLSIPVYTVISPPRSTLHILTSCYSLIKGYKLRWIRKTHIPCDNTYPAADLRSHFTPIAIFLLPDNEFIRSKDIHLDTCVRTCLRYMPVDKSWNISPYKCSYILCEIP
jgi:hypothetical protein